MANPDKIGKGWKPIWAGLETHRTVLLYRLGDLYPVIGWRQSDPGEPPVYMLEEGGDEIDHQRVYPEIWWEPTHYREIPETPFGRQHARR